MIVGDPAVFALESQVSYVYEGNRALGYFVIHVTGRIYGVREWDATMLGCSVDKVGRRILARGTHTAWCSVHEDAGEIADAFRDAVYNDNGERNFLGVSLTECDERFSIGRIAWAPDGDEAFDDGSYVLQFDVEDRVRLIAFRCGNDGRHDRATLSDVWISAETFYEVLIRWSKLFSEEVSALSKKPLMRVPYLH